MDALDPSLLDLAFKGIAEGNYFLVAGPVLALVVWAARWALGCYWPALATSDRWGVAIAAALAGVGALAHAWIADEALADSTTLLGAVKVFAAAVAAYVTARKLAAPRTTSTPAASSGPPPKNNGAIGLVSLVLLAALLAACASTREQALRTTFVGAKAAQAAFVAWDAEHQRSIASSATSVEDGLAKLDKYKADRAKVVVKFEGVYRALAAAAIVDQDDASLVTALGAWEQLRLALRALTGGQIP